MDTKPFVFQPKVNLVEEEETKKKKNRCWGNIREKVGIKRNPTVQLGFFIWSSFASHHRAQRADQSWCIQTYFAIMNIGKQKKNHILQVISFPLKCTWNILMETLPQQIKKCLNIKVVVMTKQPVWR